MEILAPTAASTGTSCPARTLVSKGVMMIAPMVEQLTLQINEKQEKNVVRSKITIWKIRVTEKEIT